MIKSRIYRPLVTARNAPDDPISESDEKIIREWREEEELLRAQKSDARLLLNGLTRKQRTFILEKLTGLSDKTAAILAGYSLSVAENTKQRVWKPQVREEFERLRRELTMRIAATEAQPCTGTASSCNAW